FFSKWETCSILFDVKKSLWFEMSSQTIAYTASQTGNLNSDLLRYRLTRYQQNEATQTNKCDKYKVSLVDVKHPRTTITRYQLYTNDHTPNYQIPHDNQYISDFLFRHDGQFSDTQSLSNLVEDEEQVHFLGYHGAESQRNALLKNLIRLRHGLKFDEQLHKEIFFEKLNFMMVLLSPQKRWRNKDRNTWCFFPHHKKCFCDYKTEGCRKQRLLVESISRLEFFNRQYQKLRESVKEKIDLSLQRFYKQNERYIRQFEEKLRRRENVKTKRQKRMLEISSYIDKIKNERRLEKIENYRKVAESAEKDEHERKLNYERLKEKLKEKRKKELEFVSPKKVTPILPPLVENDVTKEPERIDIIKEDPDLIDVTEEKSELEEEIEEEEESFSLPSIEVKMKDQKISALEKLRKIRTEKTTENAQPKRATKKKKINKLPPLTSMRSKLRLALGNREKITPKERVSITPEAESPQSKKSRRRRRKKHSSKKKHKDKTVVESTTNNNVETLREEQKPPTPPLEIEKPPETPKTPPPPPPPDYLEVDLGKEHFVQQIVLENFRDDGKKAFSIHVLDEGLATRYIRVHPTKNKNRFQINETLLGVELKQDENTKNGRRRRPKRTKRIMDTAIDENLMNRSPKPPTPPRSPLPPPSPPTSDIVENESESESSEGDFDDFEDDLIVRRSSLSTDDGSLSEKSKKADRKTSIFSLNDIQEDIEKEELLRRLKEEEEEKRLEEEHQRLMKRNRLLAEKRHQIKKQLQQKRRNQLSSNQKEKQGKMRMVRILMNKQLN
uniref:Uncharacterized protein n=2 Tax=Clytia hemisphaerica TaxID=252671 RepID=A0A7M5V3A9_9CNID